MLCSQALRAETPQVGATAPDFSLKTPEGKPVRLSSLKGHGDVVLVVLRGYPGYQCPFCQKQAHDFVTHAKAFADRGVQVLLVYPGPGAHLDEHAKEFLSQEDALPGNLHMVLDPDYKLTNLYALRWDAPQETAYPSTFLIDRHGKVFWEKVVKSHGGPDNFGAGAGRAEQKPLTAESSDGVFQRIFRLRLILLSGPLGVGFGMATVRAHVVLPAKLAEEIDALVGPRGRSAFLVETAEKELKRRKLLEILESDEPIWKEKDHPEIAERGAAAWVHNLRREKSSRQHHLDELSAEPKVG